MVGLYPIYDPKNGMDMGDERQGLRLPGVRTNHPDGSFDVEYDIPLAIFDVRLDDGVTTHQDIHDGMGEFPDAHNPSTHPEWWGKTFYKHFPNHGFVGDIFTVNGTAYPVLRGEAAQVPLPLPRRLGRPDLRVQADELDAGPEVGRRRSATHGDELQGQYRIEDGQQCMQFTQIASDGGLLPFPITRDSFELWPAKRREFIVDFTKYQDGTPTTKGDVIYLTNVMKMRDGRMWDTSSRFGPDPNYKVPMMKIVIGDNAPDDSEIPTRHASALPPLPNELAEPDGQPADLRGRARQRRRRDRVAHQRQAVRPRHGGAQPEEPARSPPLAQQRKGSFNLWEIRNGGGGWVHPFHLHMEEHRTVMRDGRDVTGTATRATRTTSPVRTWPRSIRASR